MLIYMAYIKYLILFILIGCGADKLDFPEFSTDEDYSFYLNQFKDDYYRFTGVEINQEVPLHLTDTALNETNSPGQCLSFKRSKFVYVSINKARWDTMSDNYKKTLVYHELGHCLLGLEHGEGGPIMNSSLSPSFFVEEWHLKELFSFR